MKIYATNKILRRGMLLVVALSAAAAQAATQVHEFRLDNGLKIVAEILL